MTRCHFNKKASMIVYKDDFELQINKLKEKFG